MPLKNIDNAREVDDGQWSADDLASQFKALSHPVRLKIIELLANQPNAACCGDIVDCFPYSQSTISQHLQILSRAELISLKSEGRTTCVQLNCAGLKKYSQAMSSFFSSLEASQSPLSQKPNKCSQGS
ncbi:ArsR/SmtB family transcription factor [Flexibacterium corallicola]|uniref:ArsR/SmtB family transcription factor n=1 Tax=Flexibacterium corallicola TaxID=3037259 RepID=UPI00286F6CBE|nr:metalloregulator ArsR/SmtB family transcription factor [Pseudovibrio sp. M1P-2-3]